MFGLPFSRVGCAHRTYTLAKGNGGHSPPYGAGGSSLIRGHVTGGCAHADARVFCTLPRHCGLLYHEAHVGGYSALIEAGVPPRGG
jgi:hypothetical protein